MPHRLIKQKRIAQLINGKPGENHHNPLSSTHRIPHTPLSEEGLVELAHTCHRHHFSSSGVIAIPNPRANDFDFTVDEHQHNPHHRGHVETNEAPHQNSATHIEDSATPTLTESYEEEICKVDAMKDRRTDHLLLVIVATGAPPPQLRLHSNKRAKAIPRTRRRRAD